MSEKNEQLPSLEEHILAEQATVTTYRDEARRQLDAFENQLLVLNRLLNPKPPKPVPDIESAPPEPEPEPTDQEATPAPNDTPEGTI